MHTKRYLPHAIVFGVCIAAALAWVVSADGLGQEKPKQPGKKKAAAGRTYFESTACYGCHNREQPYNDQIINPSICNCNEFEKWETQDKHRLAYLALTSERAKTMSKNLGYDVKNHKACVACHSVWIEDKKERDENQAVIEEGVGCIVCHSTENVDWVDMHASAIKKKRLDWRKLNRGQKENEHGMLDLWDPAKRTKLCVSCHLGNAKEGKLLTHDMYAAGHPPLPSFDMSNFSDAMRHWEYVAKKPAEVKELFSFDPVKAEREQVDLVNIGGLVTFRESMVLLGAQASDKKTWPELAQFDCYACHHDLKLDSWRLKRVKGGRPGRPGVPDWSTSLVQLALFHAADGKPMAAEGNIKAFTEKLDALKDAFNEQPFGNADKIVSASKALVDFVNEKTNTLQMKPVADRGVHKQLLLRLVDKQKNTTLDQDAARQVAGAFRAIYTDGWAADKRDPMIMSQLAALDDELSYTFQSESRKKSNDARIAITGELANHRKTSPLQVAPYLRSKLGPLQTIYAEEMNSHLKKINDYRPEQFQKQMNNLGARLPKEK